MKKSITLRELITGARKHGALSEHCEADQLEWFVGPVGHHRDSDLIEESNWYTVTTRMAELDPDNHDHDVLRFRHFAVGWIEELITRPGTPCAAYADECRACLDAYPILDEKHYCALEQEQIDENRPDIRRDLRRAICNYWRDNGDSCDLADGLDDMSDGDLDELSRDYGEPDGEGWYNYSKADVAAIAKACSAKLCTTTFAPEPDDVA